MIRGKAKAIGLLTTLALVGLLVLPIPGLAAPKQQSLIVATATTGGTYYPIGVGMASLWSIKLAEKHKIMAQAITSAGSGENINMMKSKEVDLSILQGMFGKMAWKGTGIYKDKPYKELRSITGLWPNVEHWVLRVDKVKSGTIADIKGLRISLGRAGSGTEQSGLAIMSGLGLTRKDIRASYLGMFESSQAMKDNKADGANMCSGPPAPAVTDIFASPGIKVTLLEFTDAQLNDIEDKSPYPGYRFIVKAGSYPGLEKDIKTIAQPNFLGVRADIPEQTIYLMTKTLFENPAYLKNVHKMAEFITLDNALGGLPAPLHPGAYKYYLEKGVKVPPALVPPKS